MLEGGIVIGGCGRSGTTLLLSILSSHPDVYAIPGETRLLCPGVYDNEPLRPPELKRLEALRRLVSGRPRWCEKTPKNVLNFDAIQLALPDVKLIHVVRDGRDVITSRHPSAPHEFWITPDRWVTEVAAGLACRDALVVRYEDLVERFEATIIDLLDRLELRQSAQVLDYPAHATITRDRAWTHPARRIHSDGVGRWRDPAHLGRVWKFYDHPQAPRLLEMLGYRP